MSGFSYKGVDIYKITTGRDNTIPGYNFNGTTTSYSGLRPNDFGLTYKGVSISNQCTASYTFCNKTETLTIPENCKSIRFVGIGGGGGSGGKGGSATQYGNYNGNTNPGGSGGSGGYGTLVTSSQPYSVSGGNSISITVGTAGGNGGNGASNSCANDRTKSWRPDWAQGGAGSPGGPGSSSTIVYQGANLLTAGGGNGGNGGNGGIIGGGVPQAVKGPGKSGNQGNSTTAPSAGNFGYQTNYGGTPGANGYVQIIYLYD
jgi:hypothetical protein